MACMVTGKIATVDGIRYTVTAQTAVEMVEEILSLKRLLIAHTAIRSVDISLEEERKPPRHAPRPSVEAASPRKRGRPPKAKPDLVEELPSTARRLRGDNGTATEDATA